jgi:hypothetical protein
MSKKLKLQQELNESVKREPSKEDCPEPSCKQHFGNSTLMMESHRTRYPGHFTVVTVALPEKDEAVLVDLEPKIYRGKKQ